jgi:tight adherence protein B
MRSVAALSAAGAFLAAGSRPVPMTVQVPRLRFGAVPSLLVGIAGAGAAIGLGAPGAVAVAAGLLLTPLPVAGANARARREVARSAARWPDFLVAVRSRIAAGASLPDSTRAAAAHLGGRYLELSRGPGTPFSTVMVDAREAWADPLADRIFTTLAASAEIGGSHVDAVLSALAASVADELRLRRAHDAALTEQRLTAGVALVAPWALLALSLATNPTAMASFSSPTGTMIVAIGLVATTLGYVLARRAARLSQAPRLFG